MSQLDVHISKSEPGNYVNTRKLISYQKRQNKTLLEGVCIRFNFSIYLY